MKWIKRIARLWRRPDIDVIRWDSGGEWCQFRVMFPDGEVVYRAMSRAELKGAV